MRTWPPQRWGVAALVAAATVLIVAIPTALIPNPAFGRSVPPTWWAWPALAATAVLSGLVTATYLRSPLARDGSGPSRPGLLGGLLAYLAVGCPVCNKLALLALGSAGALQWFAPVQPVLAVAGIALLASALWRRLQGERSCRLAPPTTPARPPVTTVAEGTSPD